MKDKFYYGMICGTIAGTILSVINLMLYYFDIVNLRYLDWMAIMIYGIKPNNALDGGFALLLNIGMTGFLGILFTYLLPLIGFEHYLMKGIVFGSGTFMFFYFITFLYRVPGLEIIPPYTAMANFVTASIFGAILGILVKKVIYDKS